ncbi:MAG: AraC family transcriptional regulator [Haliscomenobacter sp.]|uniref:AraC family transcriptional regulator n=1 Tax=Haliscomenobacter sp. TaxID=2717303 RepID=UPI0029A95555|nr:AraC family transcriptional regulator [Haliscomenobacter sp.]MDX2071783.1 AraC family transcriptional regulator [Haliscomenobacter sp.]
MKVIPFTIPVSGEQSIIIQEDREPHFYPHLHQHPEIQLTWVIEGNGNLLVGEQVHRFQTDDVFLIGANQPHLFNSDPAYFSADSSLSIHALTLFFDPHQMRQTLGSIPELSGMGAWLKDFDRGIKIGSATKARIIELMLKIQTAHSLKRVAFFLDLLECLTSGQDTFYLSQQTPFAISESEGQRMSTVFQYLLKHYADELNLEKVAAQVHLTPPAFCRYFKKHTRKTFTVFLNEIRINAACRFLKEEQSISVAEIAYSTGFNNIPHFNRTFKRVTGQRPNDWRKEKFR